MPRSGYTAEQRAALSFAALEAAEPGRWREISSRALSFTAIERSPLCQLYGSHAYGLHKLGILPGDSAGLGFAAYDDVPGDAERLLAAWVRLLATDDDTITPPQWKARP